MYFVNLIVTLATILIKYPVESSLRNFHKFSLISDVDDGI